MTFRSPAGEISRWVEKKVCVPFCVPKGSESFTYGNCLAKVLKSTLTPFLHCYIRRVYRTDPLSFLPVLAGKDGLEFRDTQQVRVRGDDEVGMFGQAGSQVETIVVRKSIFL